MNEDEALFEARREIAQLQRKIKKLKVQNESLHEHNNALLDGQYQSTNGGSMAAYREAWSRYWDVMRKCERQRLAILQIQASPRGAKHWQAEYVIDEQEDLADVC